MFDHLHSSRCERLSLRASRLLQIVVRLLLRHRDAGDAREVATHAQEGEDLEDAPQAARVCGRGEQDKLAAARDVGREAREVGLDVGRVDAELVDPDDGVAAVLAAGAVAVEPIAQMEPHMGASLTAAEKNEIPRSKQVE